VVWTGLVWLRIRTSGGLFAIAVKNPRGPKNAGKFSSGCTTGGLSSSAQLHIVC
jgi:hypothetical protein